jgi:hypothetical protein
MMKSQATQNKKQRRLAIYVCVLFGLVLITRIVLITYHNADLGGLDMNVIYGIQRIIGGAPLYQHPGQPTYAIMQYSPLFYYAVAGIARIMHIDMRDVYHVYMTTRIVSLACNLITVLLTASIIRMGGFSRRRVWTFSLPLLIVLTFEHYTRVDSMHLLFFAATMLLALRYVRNGRLRHLVFAAFTAGGCIMCKQSGVLAVGIVSFYLLFVARRYAPAFLFPLLSLVFAAIAGWLCIGNGWQEAYENTCLGLKNGIDPSWLYTIFISQFYYDLILCYLLGGIIVWSAFKVIKDKCYLFIATGAGLSFLFALITGLKVGSGNNYFTEFLFFCLCGLPWLLRDQYGRHRIFRIGSRTLTVGGFGIIAFFILISSKTMGLTSSVYIERWIKNKKEVYYHQQDLLAFFTRDSLLRPGEYVYFGNRDFLDNLFINYSLLPTKDVITQVYRTDAGTFDYSPLLKGMNNGMIRFVVTPAEYNSVNNKDEEIPFVHFDESRFRLFAQVAGYSIYQYQAQTAHL